MISSHVKIMLFSDVKISPPYYGNTKKSRHSHQKLKDLVFIGVYIIEANRMLYMAAWSCEISLVVLKNISLVRYAHS